MQPDSKLTDGQAASRFSDPTFSSDLIAWQKRHGRHTLPWQNTRGAYSVWLSEIMLQQTQVSAVIPYYERFLQRFPDVFSLAQAAPDEVMAHWSGLGYYSRARNLHACAKRVVQEYGGRFPSDPALLAELPGIGRSTAAAIAAFSYGVRAAILDGNVKRVFARVFGVEGYPGAKTVENELWDRAQALLPERDIEAYTQGLMDLGATLCTRGKPDCPRCPLASRCVARATGRTAELPVPKPKKSVPERHKAMLVILDEGKVLLEQRPGTGIWGGLWSLPESDELQLAHPDEAPADDSLGERLGQLAGPFGNMAHWERLTPFTHAFTHFKLHVSPYLIRLSSRRLGIGQSGHVWQALHELQSAPLPAPVRRLLGALAQPSLLPPI